MQTYKPIQRKTSYIFFALTLLPLTTLIANRTDTFIIVVSLLFMTVILLLAIFTLRISMSLIEIDKDNLKYKIYHPFNIKEGIINIKELNQLKITESAEGMNNFLIIQRKYDFYTRDKSFYLIILETKGMIMLNDLIRQIKPNIQIK